MWLTPHPWPENTICLWISVLGVPVVLEPLIFFQPSIFTNQNGGWQKFDYDNVKLVCFKIDKLSSCSIFFSLPCTFFPH